MTLRHRLSLAILCLAGPPAFGQTGGPPVIAPADNLVVEGVPPIPAALADEVGRYTELRGANFSSWHPARREMLIGTRFGNTIQAHLVKFPGGARTQMTFYPDRICGARFEPTAGKSFIFSKDAGGNEFFQLYRCDFADGSVTLLTDGKSRNTGAVWSNGGRWIAYGSTRRTGNDVDIYVVEAANPKSDRRVLELTGGGWSVADWSPDDSKLLLSEAISANESYLWLADVAAGSKTLLTPKGKEKIAYGNAASDPALHYGLGLDLDEHGGIDQPSHLDHRRRRTDVAENLAVGAADFFPVLDVGDVHPRAHDVAERGSGLLERGSDVPKRLDRLRIGVAGPDDPAVGAGRGRPRNVDHVSDPDGPRVADDRLPGRAAREVPPHHGPPAAASPPRYRSLRSRQRDSAISRRRAALSGARSGLPSGSGKA